MRKLFTIYFAMLFALVVYAQENQQNEGNQKVWWGYVGENDKCSGLGTNKAETYHCASFFPGTNSVIAGKSIHAVRFQMLSSNVKDVKVWISDKLPSDLERDAFEVVSVSSTKTGLNEVALTSPYTVGTKGVYVGYTFTITRVQYQGDAYPVATTGTDMQNALILKTSSSVTSWGDLNGQGFGRLYLQVLLEGDFAYKNGAAFAVDDFGEVVAAIGGSNKAWMHVTNMGTEPLRSIDYTITTDGVTGEEQHIDIDPSVGFGNTKVVTIGVVGDDTAGQKVKTVTLTKVNGVANEYAATPAQFTMTTVSKIAHRGIAVEEFTGTLCGWCPRGIAGMEKLREKYGDHFVGAAVHGYANGVSDDAMYLTGYSTKYAKIFSGAAPACLLNRTAEIDPYYGSGSDICADFENELSVPATVAVDVTGEWNADSTQVTATATLEALTSGQKYSIEYALIADGLTGTSAAWNQKNFYTNYNASDFSDTPDIAQFCSGGKYGQSSIKGWTFNDAVIATCYTSGRNQTTAPGAIETGDIVTNTFTLTMPASTELKKAIVKEKVAVVAFVIAADGTVANAAKFYMPGNGVTDSVDGIKTAKQAPASRYAIDGRRLQHGEKGLNIVRQADGTVRKVFVK